jgi:hypothetical protein
VKLVAGHGSVRKLQIERCEGVREFLIEGFLGELDPAVLRVELYADPLAGHPSNRAWRWSEKIESVRNGFVYQARIISDRSRSLDAENSAGASDLTGFRLSNLISCGFR